MWLKKSPRRIETRKIDDNMPKEHSQLFVYVSGNWMVTLTSSSSGIVTMRSVTACRIFRETSHAQSFFEGVDRKDIYFFTETEGERARVPANCSCYVSLGKEHMSPSVRHR